MKNKAPVKVSREEAREVWRQGNFSQPLTAERLDREAAIQGEASTRASAIQSIRDDPRFASSLQIGAAAGGSLAGSYPNPSLAQNSVGSFQASPEFLNSSHFTQVSGFGKTLPPNVYIRRVQVPANTISGAELLSSTTTDAERAVTSAHLRDKAGRNRVLDDNAADPRVLASHPTDDAARAVGENHVKNSVIGIRALKTGELDTLYRRAGVTIKTPDYAERSVARTKLALNAVGTDELGTNVVWPANIDMVRLYAVLDNRYARI